MKLNLFTASLLLLSSMVLASPGNSCATRHAASRRDTCGSIAREYGISVQELQRWNDNLGGNPRHCNKPVPGRSYCVKPRRRSNHGEDYGRDHGRDDRRDHGFHKRAKGLGDHHGIKEIKKHKPFKHHKPKPFKHHKPKPFKHHKRKEVDVTEDVDIIELEKRKAGPSNAHDKHPVKHHKPEPIKHHKSKPIKHHKPEPIKHHKPEPIKHHKPEHHKREEHGKGPSNDHGKGSSNEHGKGSSNEHGKGPSNEHGKGPSNDHGKGPSNEPGKEHGGHQDDRNDHRRPNTRGLHLAPHTDPNCRRYYVAKRDDSCRGIARRNHISENQFYKYNQGLRRRGDHQCVNLSPGRAYCVAV
ncbi:hypothetical protein J3Q64DRAFT_1850737 [Phycomyces blakesleeanus]|uniref:LysM domain-containing protein n=2 Tax=Phycomyces blakesleeanus TaxID=4837 RepID=A0A162N8L6_PHYB8|nr:hypothetical protein PHYBLDRAFT_183743 [Phycomyces blakesleeanus NRRL 1555(-)]OAD66854.1 hypothetical protein PHYBLDRAFT_183743 [Phycomyces blakesleeanus NRRL 1555(-)]|eukprot:XP_018284894.1 hypothetical protein PHYBLDRAFT_183743 [Phycomyces blakesleeanus NRRL 1555(-)]